MASGREIKTKIKSTQNMRKVTRALEMVSASKIRKAQDLMKASRPYAKAMRKVIAHVAQANTDFPHPFLAEGDVGAVVVALAVVHAGDRHPVRVDLVGERHPVLRPWQQLAEGAKGRPVVVVAHVLAQRRAPVPVGEDVLGPPDRQR